MTASAQIAIYPLRQERLTPAVEAVQQALAAHALKGAMQNMGAVPGAEAALRLETIGHTGDMTLADESLTALKQEFARLESALGQVAKEVQA